MISPTFINLLDFFVLSATLLFAFEALRVTHFKAEPLCAVAFALITIGSFGWAVNDLYGVVVPIYALVLHTGFAIHVMLLYAKQLKLAVNQTRRRSDLPYQVTTPASQGASNPPPRQP